MSAESAMDVRLGEAEEGAGTEAEGPARDAVGREGATAGASAESAPAVASARFGSTRLLRELLAADACAAAEGADRASLARRLLAVTSRGLEAPLAALVDAESLASLAASELPEAVRAVLEGRVSGGGGGGVPLVRRSLDERRAFLLRRASRDPLMVVLRDALPEIAAVALVPLWDGELGAGVLVLGTRSEEALSEAVLASLGAAFRLFGLLVSPARGRRAGAGSAESERYAVEMEELEARLAETRDALQQARERAASELAGLRADLEAERARAAELEARMAAERGERERGQGFEAECRRLEEELAARSAETRAAEARLVALEGEAERLRERVADLEREAGARIEAAEEADAAEEAEEAVAEEAETAPLLASGAELEPPREGELEEIVARAAAALDADGEAASAQEASDGEEARPEPRQAESEEARAGPRSLLLLDSSEDLQRLVRELAASSGRHLADPGLPEAGGGEVVLANLFDPLSVDGASLLRPAPGRRFHLYGWDPEAAVGFELGRVSCLPRPLAPGEALEELRSLAGRRLGGVLLVSARLRDLAGLRAALAEIDVAGSVAYDGRQALDLLEIVRQPDALVVDLELADGQGLALVDALRRQPATSALPIALLLPERLDPAALRRDAERAGLLAPCGIEDLRRLVSGALAASG